MHRTLKLQSLAVVLAMGAIASGARQATPCQQQQAGPTTNELIDAAAQNLQDMSDLADKYIEAFVAADAERASLKQQVLDLVAGDEATREQAAALFAKSEEVENRLRAGLPGVPPVGGQPLLNSYADRASFDVAVEGYTGPEAVTLDGTEVKAGTIPSLDYFTHSATGEINTTGPTD